MQEQLKLDNQLCFRLYTASRLITQAYHPLLSGIGLTYPQYLVMMVLWEKDGMPVNDIAKKLYLETNTVTRTRPGSPGRLHPFPIGPGCGLPKHHPGNRPRPLRNPGRPNPDPGQGVKGVIVNSLFYRHFKNNPRSNFERGLLYKAMTIR